MKVLMIIPGSEIGPSMIFAKREAGLLNNNYKHEIDLRVEYITFDYSFKELTSQFKGIYVKLLKYKPGIIHAQYGTFTAFIGACLAVVGKCKLVITYRGSDLNADVTVSRLRSHLQKILSQVAAVKASGIICVSEQLKQKLIFYKKNAIVIPSGVDGNVFAPANREICRRKLNLDLNEKIIVFNSRPSDKNKREDLLLDALDIVRAHYKKTIVYKLDGTIDSNIVPLILNASDCLVLTSDFEGSPTIVQESLACNLPVVSVDVGDVRQVLQGVNNSFIVQRNKHKVAGKIIEIFDSNKRSNGSLFINKYLLTSNIKKIIQVYKRIY